MNRSEKGSCQCPVHWGRSKVVTFGVGQRASLVQPAGREEPDAVHLLDFRLYVCVCVFVRVRCPTCCFFHSIPRLSPDFAGFRLFVNPSNLPRLAKRLHLASDIASHAPTRTDAF